ncbi:hypothetical protein QFZ63_003857 [Streptomyces sp. B3I7]|uniref:hypothetical protein n=1 Tax=unclassified Streptomyces TaxID=2593676 RepID=UPI00277E0759|nr:MULTISPECIES: hypothetical protein [unclassified Streptomyces]MDQ0788261.1 hypothetical protein [Streptomyces sp. B3I8]MDQ0812143.1 hypothetical protein [Streptomyces sp. B3I7]
MTEYGSRPDDGQQAGNPTVKHRPEDHGRPAAPGDEPADRTTPASGTDAVDAAHGSASDGESDSGGDGHGGPAGRRDGSGAFGGTAAGRDRLLAALGGFGGPTAGSTHADDGTDARTGTGRNTDEGTGTGADGDTHDDELGLASDELALRRVLHSAVGDIAPRDGTLEHLRRAVPARRARKRQALVGMAAAALFACTAVPALVHVSRATGSPADPSIAGQASQAHGGMGEDKGEGSGSGGSGGASDSVKEKGDSGHHGKQGKGTGKGRGTTGSGSTTPGSSLADCTAAQLGGATSSVNPADAAGVVYGTFRVANISGTTCTVSGPGTVGATPQGAADPARVTVVSHVTGDAATALPDPSQELASLILKPGMAYQVKFAWVPSETCPTQGDGDGGTGTGPSPDPSASDGTAGASEGASSTSGSSTLSSQLLREDGVADGSVVVSHTAAAGSPTVTATVPNACAGTIYRTGVLAGS